MSKKSNGIVNTILNLVVSFLMVFVIMATTVCFVGNYLTSSPEFCINQVEKTNISQTVYNTMKRNFETQYSTTAIPPEVYLDVIDKEWIENAIIKQIEVTYSLISGESRISYSPDYSALEASITDYFEKYAEENNYVKDDLYNKKLAQTIENTKISINNSVDVYKLETMKRANIWSKVGKLGKTIDEIFPVCIIAMVVLLILLIVLKNPIYWLGTSLFTSGTIFTVPCAWVLTSSVIQRFTIKEVSIYTIVTSAMTSLTELVLSIGIVMLVSALIMIISGIILERVNYYKKTNRNS